ncbi:MAG: sigma-70 family RNA polymerase sigma factor [Planctomycetota bacterium]
MKDHELKAALMRRADSMHQFLESRIPKRFRLFLTPDDLLQDVWAAAFKSYPDSMDRDDATFDRWLNTIAKNRLLNAIRDAGRIKRGGHRNRFEQQELHNSSFAALLTHLVGPDRTPSSEEAANDVVQAVRSAISSLPEDYRQALTLRHIEGRSQDEVATTMKRSQRAINSLLYRGLQRLNQNLGSGTRFFSDLDSQDDGPLQSQS